MCKNALKFVILFLHEITRKSMVKIAHEWALDEQALCCLFHLQQCVANLGQIETCVLSWALFFFFFNTMYFVSIRLAFSHIFRMVL